MLSDFHMHARNLEDLSFLVSFNRLLALRVPATASFRTMHYDLIGSGHALECCSLMARQATGLSLALLSFHIRTTSRSITGGRLAAVVAVLLAALLQFLNAPLMFFDNGKQGVLKILEQRDDRLRTRAVSVENLRALNAR